MIAASEARMRREFTSGERGLDERERKIVRRIQLHEESIETVVSGAQQIRDQLLEVRADAQAMKTVTTEIKTRLEALEPRRP